MNDHPLNNRRLDKIAIFVSGVCLVHCLAIPVSVLLLPSFAAPLTGHQTLVHWILLGIALPISGWALWSGYRIHRYRPSGWLGGIGMLVMFLGVSHLAGEAQEVVLTVVGVSLLIAAHVLNMSQHLRSSG